MIYFVKFDTWQMQHRSYDGFGDKSLYHWQIQIFQLFVLVDKAGQGYGKNDRYTPKLSKNHPDDFAVIAADYTMAVADDNPKHK